MDIFTVNMIPGCSVVCFCCPCHIKVEVEECGGVKEGGQTKIELQILQWKERVLEQTFYDNPSIIHGENK